MTATQAGRTGTVGVYSNSTSVATKTNTPLINIPQSVSVLTKDFIKDQSFQSVTEATRYVPGVAVHQGEGNRDELVIRGVDSSANFFVNGFRDDVQIFRDLYNTQSIEVLKGPSALTFGRGVGGGLVNRTLKEADGQRIYEVTGQTGSYWDRRVSFDAGQAVTENFAARLNAVYEKSDTFRDFGKLERFGINPTVTFKPEENTKVKLSYELFHDERTADRGNPSQGLSAVAPSSTRANPAVPFAPNGDLTRILRQPDPQRRARRRADRNGVRRARFPERIDGEELDAGRAIPEVLSERLSRQRALVGRGESGRHRVQPRRLSITRPTATTPSTRPTSSTRARPARSCIPSASAPSSAGRPASTYATPASSRTAPTRSSAIRSIRPISARSTSSITPRRLMPTASPRPTPTANIARTRSRAMCATRSKSPAICS